MSRRIIQGPITIIFFLFFTLLDFSSFPKALPLEAVSEQPVIARATDPESARSTAGEGSFELDPTESADEADLISNSEEAGGNTESGQNYGQQPSRFQTEPEPLTQLAKDWAKAQVEIAQDFCDKGLYKEGIPWASDALRLDPGLPEAHLIWGYINFKMLNTEVAMDAFKRTIDLDPSNFNAHLYLGVIYNGKNDPDTAIEYLTRSIHIARCPEDISMAYTHRGLSYALMLRYDESFADLEDALYLDPDNGWAILVRGVVSQEKARREEAASEYEGIPGRSSGFAP